MLLSRYIASTVVSTVLLVLFVLIGLEVLINFIGELSDIGAGDYGVFQALEFVLLDMPRHIYLFFPMAALVGVLMGLGLLANHSELLVMRASGFSVAQISSVVVLVAFLLVLLMTVIGEAAGPVLKHIAEERKAIAISGGQALKTISGTWLRDGQNFLYIETILPGAHLQGVTHYEFDGEHRLLSVTYAKQAVYQHHQWVLQDVQQSRISGTTVTAQHVDEAPLAISLNPRLLRISQIESDEMTLGQLRSYVTYRERNGLRASSYDLAFWQRVFQPFATALMMFLALPFILGPLRSATVGLRLVAGIGVGFVFYILNQFFGPMSVVYQFPPILAAISPTILVGVVAMVLLWRAG